MLLLILTMIPNAICFGALFNNEYPLLILALPHKSTKYMPVLSKFSSVQNSPRFHVPGDVGVKGGNLRVEPLVSSDEGVFPDLPDLSVVVPRSQVVLEILCVVLHALIYHLLDLMCLLILLYY